MDMDYWNKIEWERFLGHSLATVLIIFGALIVWLVLARSFRALESRSRVSPALLLPLRLFLRYGVMLIAILLCLTAYGIPIGNFWTLVSTALGLVAIGFVAVWSVLSNISSTFLILLVQPFKVGDYVSLVGEEVSGRVVDINFLFTTIRRKSGDVFKVPNNQFFQKCVLRPADPDRLENENSASNEKDGVEQAAVPLGEAVGGEPVRVASR